MGANVPVAESKPAIIKSYPFSSNPVCTSLEKFISVNQWQNASMLQLNLISTVEDCQFRISSCLHYKEAACYIYRKVLHVRAKTCAEVN